MTCKHDIDYDLEPVLLSDRGNTILGADCVYCGELVLQFNEDDWRTRKEFKEHYHWPEPVQSEYAKSYLQWMHADDSTHDRALSKFGLALQTISIGYGGLVTPEETAELLASKPFENHRTTRQSDRENKQ